MGRDWVFSALRRELTGWKGASRGIAWVWNMNMLKVGLWMLEQVLWFCFVQALYEFVHGIVRSYGRAE